MLVLLSASSLTAQEAASPWEPQQPRLPLRTVTVFGMSIFRAEFERYIAPLIEEPWDPRLFQKAVEAITRRYQEAGYRFARAERIKVTTFEEGLHAGHYVTLYFDEGWITEISIQGLSRTREEVIRKQLLLDVGERFFQPDLEESERILREKKYLGEVLITAEADPVTNNVRVLVLVEDLWSFLPTVRLVRSGDSGEGSLLDRIRDGEVGVQLTVQDYNLFGTGQDWRFQLRWEPHTLPGTPELRGHRGRVALEFHEPNLFRSRWQLDGFYHQPSDLDIDSWALRLHRPFYSLRSRWSFEARIGEEGFRGNFRYQGRTLREWAVRQEERFVQGLYALGTPEAQARLGAWMLVQQRSDQLLFSALPVIPYEAFRRLSERDQKRFSPEGVPERRAVVLGGTLAWQAIQFVRDINVDLLGEVEDLALGETASVSLGVGSQRWGSDRDALHLSTALRFRRRWGVAEQEFAPQRPQPQVQWTGVAFEWTSPPARRRSAARIEWRPPEGWNALWSGELTLQAAYAWTGGTIGATGWRNLSLRAGTRLFLRFRTQDALVSRLQLDLVGNPDRDFNWNLGNRTGLRGYPSTAFDGNFRLLWNLELRRVFWTHRWFVLQGAAFLDQGVIGWDRLPDARWKASVGVGVRVGVKRLSSSPILRLDLAIPWDRAYGWTVTMETGQPF
ncbi:MAG: hypothetical protein KatS3mg115_1972 [Candidatus Poribacteria bacterium]|nr:MAG: hypothetical protein KatS3mg115_1972 [Candidatus Poribacteria bacterium]